MKRKRLHTLLLRGNNGADLVESEDLISTNSSEHWVSTLRKTMKSSYDLAASLVLVHTNTVVWNKICKRDLRE